MSPTINVPSTAVQPLTCGRCRLFHDRLCYLDPPKLLVVSRPTSGGQFETVESWRPEVDAADPACASISLRFE